MCSVGGKGGERLDRTLSQMVFVLGSQGTLNQGGVDISTPIHGAEETQTRGLTMTFYLKLQSRRHLAIPLICGENVIA